MPGGGSQLVPTWSKTGGGGAASFKIHYEGRRMSKLLSPYIAHVVDTVGDVQHEVTEENRVNRH